MMADGLLDEVEALAARPGGLSRTARQALGYRELLAHVEGGVPLDEAVAAAIRRTRAFARRQMAWFRRDPRIVWLTPRTTRWVRSGPVCVGSAPTRAQWETGPSTMNPPERRRLRLTKHHGAGNDFLVLLDPDDEPPSTLAEVRALCDRRFGVGADGVIRVLAGARTAPSWPWSCATPTGARPR